MSERLKQLPEFRSPPVIEVVFGVQFEEVASFSSVHFGEFWQRVKQTYPNVEDHAPLADVFEVEGRGSRQVAGPSPAALQAPGAVIPLEQPPLRRVFYVDESGNYLLQLQPTRFLANWRKKSDGDPYPRFPAVKKRFATGWKSLLKFLADAHVGTPKVNHYELTYINHILEEACEPFPAGIEHFLPVFAWGSAQSTRFLEKPGAMNLMFQFALPHGKGALQVTVNHGIRRSDRRPGAPRRSGRRGQTQIRAGHYV